MVLFTLALASVELTSSYRFYQVNVYKIALALILISALAPLVLMGAFRRQLPAPSLPLLLLWALPLLVTLPGIWVTQGKWAYGAPEQVTQGLTVLAWTWLAWALAQAGQGMRLLAALFYIGGASAIMALLETAMLGHLTPGVFRAKASFGNPGYLAGWLLMVMPLGLARVASTPVANISLPLRPFPLARWVLWGFDCTLTLTVIAALMVNKTRVAQLLTLGVLAVTGTLLLIRWLRRYRLSTALIYIGAPGITLGIGGMLAWQADIWARFQTLAHGGDWQGRWVPWRTAIEAFSHSPWLGHGPGSYYSLFFQYVDAESRAFWIERSYFDPHNQLLDMAVEGGALGVLTGLLVWGAWVWLLVRNVRDARLTGPQRFHTLGVIAGLGLMLAFSLTAVSYRMMTLMLPAQVLLASTLGLAPTFRRESPCYWMLWPLIIGLAWWLGQAGLYSKHRYAAIEAMPAKERYAPLQALCDKAPNIYALERLLQQSLIHRDWPRFFNTVRQIEQRIPHYRTTRHIIAQGYMRRGDIRNARKAALDFQRRDRYYADNNKLLIRIAILQRDTRLLQAQVENALRYSLHKQGLLASGDVESRLETGEAFNLSTRSVMDNTFIVQIPAQTQAFIRASLIQYYREKTPQNRLLVSNKIRYVLAPLTSEITQRTGKPDFVDQLLLQLI